MILVQDLRDQLLFALDAEGSDHYRDDLDIIPAINASTRWLTTLINTAYGQNKISEEFFRELSYSGVFRASDASRVSLNVFPSEVWTILAIYVKPTTESISGIPTTATPDDKQSYFLPEKLHLSAELDCKRLTLEEWARNKKNPFEHGYDGAEICDNLKLYAYLSPINYRLQTVMNEIEIRPNIGNEEVTIFWAKKPDVVTSMTDTIDFPSSTFQLLFDKALNYISYKQGDNTNLFAVSSADIQQLLTAL